MERMLLVVLTGVDYLELVLSEIRTLSGSGSG